MQGNLPLLSSMQGPPKAAPPKVLRQVETVAQAIDVSIRMCGFKAAYVAGSLGVSEAYVSMLRKGLRPLPAGLRGRNFVTEFCRITQSSLLEQVLRRDQIDAEDEGAMLPWQVNARIAAMARTA